MNHVAHCFLSFDNEDLLLGNFIGDFVKGSDWQRYPKTVQQGILLHRAIDSFTDNHPATNDSVRRIRSYTGRYAPPMIDVLYDHLLCLHWSLYAAEPFDVFAEKTYQYLQNKAQLMPAPLDERLPRMLSAHFLHGYTTQEGMQFVIERFSRRLPPTVDSAGLLRYFFDHLDDFGADFNRFFPDLLQHAREKSMV